VATQVRVLGEAADRSGRVRATQDPGGYPSSAEHSGLSIAWCVERSRCLGVW
jgi:hypothetical protein